MQIDYMTLYAFMVLSAYFMFLAGIGFATRNVDRIAEHPVTEALMNKFHYNLRDIPRVDYKEPSSDEDLSEAPEESETSEFNNSYNGTADLVKRRRDRNAYNRIMDTD